MHSAQLQDLVSDISAASTPDELRTTCGQFCRLVNAPWYLLGVVSLRSLSASRVHVLTNYPGDWISAYLENKYQRADPVVQYILSRNAPIYWSDLMKQGEFRTPERLELMRMAQQHGLENGLSIPIHSASGDIAVFSLSVSDNSRQGLELLESALPYAHTFSIHLFERYIQVLGERRQTWPAPILTERQQACLFWACEGKTTWEIAQILQIKERTVEFHLQNAAERLGASSRQHAVSMALIKGLVKPQL